MKFSIIMPVFNVESYLHKSIQSILMQSFKDFEFIIVDDGSTDLSKSIIKKYLKDERVRLLTQKNCGVSTARNRALLNAKGEYVYFIDADDYVMNVDFLSEINDALDSFKSDMVIFGYEMESQKSGKKIIKAPFSTLKLTSNELVKKLDLVEDSVDINSLWNKVYKKSFLTNIGAFFLKDVSVGEDALFNYTCLRSLNKVILLDKVYYHYIFQRKGSAMNTLNLNRMNQRLQVIEEYKRFRDGISNPNDNKVLQKEVSCFYSEIYSNLFSRENGFKIKLQNLFEIKKVFVKYNLLSFRILLKLKNHKAQVKQLCSLIVLMTLPGRRNND